MIKSLLLVILFLMCFSWISVYADIPPVPILAAVLSGDVIATDSNGADVDIPDGTIVSAYSLDGELYGSITIKNNHYNNLLVSADNVTEIVKFKVGELYAEEEYTFISGEMLNLDLNVKNWVIEQPENGEGSSSGGGSSGGGRSKIPSSSKKEETIIEEIVIPPNETQIVSNPPLEEKESRESEGEMPITGAAVTFNANPQLGYGILVVFIVVLIGIGIYLIIFKKRARLRKMEENNR